MLNSNTFSTCPHNMMNFSPLTAEIYSGVWGTPANFNGFRDLAALLQRRHSPEANQTLHDVRPWLIDYMHIFGGCSPVTEFYHMQNSLCVLQVLRCPISSVIARHSSSGHEPNIAALSTGIGRHLYSAGRPSRWAMAHIVVLSVLVLA